ncbi:Ger(x)C family spore germination protein [Paenibacillus sp. strain BS8-2]
MMRCRSFKSISIIVLCVCCLLVTGGCWSRRELNDISIIIAIGIDKIDNKYQVTLQIVDPTQMRQNPVQGRSPSIVQTMQANTIFEAVRKITTTSSRTTYAGHLKLLVVSEAIAKEGLASQLDLFIRSPRVRPDFTIAVARDVSAQDVLSIITPMEVLPGIEMYKSLKTSERAWAPTSSVRLFDFLSALHNEGIQPVLTGITINGDVEEGKRAGNIKQAKSFANFRFTGIGVMKDDRLLGWLNEQDSKSFSYLTDRVHTTVGKIRCPGEDKWFVVEVTKASSNIKTFVREDNPYAEITQRIDGNLSEYPCKLDITKEDQFLLLQEAGRKQTESLLQNGLKKVQNQYGTDIYGFGEKFHQNHPKQWTAWSNDWDRRFKNMDITIKVVYNLNYMGEITNPILHKKEDTSK